MGMGLGFGGIGSLFGAILHYPEATLAHSLCPSKENIIDRQTSVTNKSGQLCPWSNKPRTL